MFKKTRLPMLSAALVLAVAGIPAAGIAQAPGGSPDPKAVQAGSYQVEPGHTQVGFSVLHIGFTHYDGTFSTASGELKLDPASPASDSLAVTVPVASVQTTSAKLDEELKSDQWLDAAKYPTMQFRSTKVTRTGESSATIFGTLTLHGVTRPVTLQARFVGAGANPLDKSYTVGFSATGTINRSDFGVKTYLPMIGDQVLLHINAAFTKK